jgi:ribosome biogenesis GTPase
MSRKKERKQRERERWVAQKKRRKTIRHNTAANQEKHRPDWRPLEPNADGVIPDRRIMPRDERDRRDTGAALADRPVSSPAGAEFWATAAADSPYELGVVLAVGRGKCHVEMTADTWLCDLRGALIAEGTGLSNVVAAGDRVLVQPLEPGHGVIETVLPRRSALARPDPFYAHLKQIIAANVDQVLIVASWREPHLWLGLIDQYLIAAIRNNLSATICLNKMDLAADCREAEQLLQPYAELGYPLLFTSAISGRGLTDLKKVLQDQTTVLSGMSGVGKSTLITAVDPTLDLKTNPVSQWHFEGRHTTTQSILLPLNGGGYVVDTPGLRDLGLGGLFAEELIAYYPDIAEPAGACRFRDCTHSHEPGCAVKAAVAGGELADWRLDNYVKLYTELG